MIKNNIIKKIGKIKRVLLSTLLLLVTSAGLSAQTVLLVSLSMPDPALKAYLTQGHQYHIPVVIRGLYTEKQNQNQAANMGNFKETAQRIKNLTVETKVGGVSINPLIFRAFDIKAVPALVVYDDNLSCIEQTASAPNTPCDDTHFDVIYGNLPISHLLSIVASQSTSNTRADFSERLLNQYKKSGESV